MQPLEDSSFYLFLVIEFSAAEQLFKRTREMIEHFPSHCCQSWSGEIGHMCNRATLKTADLNSYFIWLLSKIHEGHCNMQHSLCSSQEIIHMNKATLVTEKENSHQKVFNVFSCVTKVNFVCAHSKSLAYLQQFLNSFYH